VSVTRGIQARVLVSLTFVMATATLALAAFMLRAQTLQLDTFRPLVARALQAEAESSTFEMIGGSKGITWWIFDGKNLHSIGDNRLKPAPHVHELVDVVHREGRLVTGGRLPWNPIRFGIPLAGNEGSVAVAEVAPVISGSVLLMLLFADCVVFIAMGSYLLRRSVVLPLHQLASAARAIGLGETGTRVPEIGEGEAAEVGRAFNEMSEHLEKRSDELGKAVLELRSSNQSLRRARDGLDRAERLAAVGSLAAGVAHEVGNPMGALLAFLDLAKREPSLSGQGQELLGRASEQGMRVREILRELLDFSRPPRSSPQPMDLEEVARKTVGLLETQGKYDAIRFDVEEPDAPVPMVVGDQGMVAQILLNLLVNAGDAALDGLEHEQREPRVTIELRPAPLYVRLGADRKKSQERNTLDGVECKISDSGLGIASGDSERIFDPFFTSKDPGEGTGLGLSNALRLAEEMGGVVELAASEKLPGAAFVLRLANATPDRESGVRGTRR
jgi:two-component system NtrC family sensor kinase